ncbi:hypothetical protein AHAS_Ahas10G0125900 [Arachis hypogaea]
MYYNWYKSFSTYSRSYDFLHVDYMFSRLKKICIDQILRSKSTLIVRDIVEVINELESMVKFIN